MNRRRLEFVLAFSVAVVALVGCDRDMAETTAAPATMTPEEKFELIVDTFRRAMETDASTVIATGGAGQQAAVSISNTVKHQLTPPAKEGELYRGTITVESYSHYSIQRTPSQQEAVGDDEAGNETGSRTAGGVESNVEISDAELIGGVSSRPRRVPSVLGKTGPLARPNEHIRTFELEYRNGRWELVSKLDPETEQAVQTAFRHALKTQD
jgi:hypothetical protein